MERIGPVKVNPVTGKVMTNEQGQPLIDYDLGIPRRRLLRVPIRLVLQNLHFSNIDLRRDTHRCRRVPDMWTSCISTFSTGGL
jgi:hypothetical protein